MRQVYLAILIISGICMADMQNREFQISVPNGKTCNSTSYSAVAKIHPFGAYEISQPGFTSGHSGRQQYPDVSFEHKSIEDISRQHDNHENNGFALFSAPKYYLSFIYPSHNFW